MNILLTCVGRRNYIVDYFRDALKPYSGKVFAANSIRESSGLVAADQAIIVPSLYSEHYVDVLIEICVTNQITAIISLFDLELPILARAKAQFAANGIQCVVSDSRVIEICNDKLKMHRFLSEHGYCCPRTYTSLDKARSALQQGILEYPVVIKPRWGTGSLSMFEAENDAEMMVLFHKAKTMLRRTYLTQQSENEPDRDILIQEKIVGHEYGLDVINDLGGEYVTTFAKRKIAMRSGETDVAVTVSDDRLSQLGKELGGLLRHIAILDVDVFVDEKKRLYVLDLNPRFGGGYPFSQLAGANIPAAIIAWLSGEIPKPDWLRICPDVTGFKGLVMMCDNLSF